MGTEDDRKTLKDDVEKFLAEGGHVEEVPMGEAKTNDYTMSDWTKLRRSAKQEKSENQNSSAQDEDDLSTPEP